jgi:hypothetical protein
VAVCYQVRVEISRDSQLRMSEEHGDFYQLHAFGSHDARSAVSQNRESAHAVRPHNRGGVRPIE